MAAAFLEVVIPLNARIESPVSWRQHLESELDDILSSSGLGEVTGGGTSASTANIDVDIEDDRSVAEAIRVIIDCLRRCTVPRGARVIRYSPEKNVCFVYEDMNIDP